MAKRRISIISLFICLCFWIMPCYAISASTTDAVEPINIDNVCSVTLSYICEETTLKDIDVKLYKIADVSADFQYTLTDNFAVSNLILNGIKSTNEWNVVRSTLEAHIISGNITADNEAATNSQGQVCFSSLKPGLYLAVVGLVNFEDVSCNFDSVLVSLPDLNTDGQWQYNVSVNAKSEIIPPIDEEVTFKVVKLWKGDEGTNYRPKRIEIEIYKDGTSFNKVILSQQNNWSYSWSAKNDANWTVVEISETKDYSMTVEERENSFIITNTLVSKKPGSNAPQTGDTSNIMFYIISTIFSGSMLIILGIIGKRNANEEN